MPDICGWGAVGRPGDKNPYTATLKRVGEAHSVEWWAPGGNDVNWVRLIGDGKMVKLWNDALNPAGTRIWIEVFANPMSGEALIRRECYTLSQCWLHTRKDQIYYIRGAIMTGTGCTRWNFDDP